MLKIATRLLDMYIAYPRFCSVLSILILFMLLSSLAFTFMFVTAAPGGGGGGGVLPEKLGESVRPASQSPYPVYDQNLRNSLPYL